MTTSKTHRVEFVGSQGDTLAARLDLPTGDTPRAYAIFAHCFTCSKDILAATRVSRELALRGVAVLRFDFTGLGHSGGEFANTSFSSNVEDLVLAADWLRREHDAPSILIGHSLGGAAVLAAAGSIPESVAVATIGAPADPAHVAALLGPARQQIEQTGEGTVSIGGRSFTLRKQFLDDLAEQKQRSRIADLRKALLVMHSPVDTIVGIDNAAAIFEAAKHPKSFVSLDNADHLLSRREDAVYVAEVLGAWVGRFLPPVEVPASASPEPGEVIVQETGTGKFTQDVLIGPHRLRGDEPVAAGGDDAGPTPYGFLLAALGTCTSMTLRMYAQHKGLPVDDIQVRLRHDRVHAADCETCETETGRVDRITKSITITGDLTDAQRQRMLEIADRCPVHRTLNSEIAIKTAPSLKQAGKDAGAASGVQA